MKAWPHSRILLMFIHYHLRRKLVSVVVDVPHVRLCCEESLWEPDVVEKQERMRYIRGGRATFDFLISAHLQTKTSDALQSLNRSILSSTLKPILRTGWTDTMSGVTPREYQIGWICALHKELAAAKAMLDEEYNDLIEQDLSDNNSYVLGRIHQHNVVIACMEEGIDGLVSAASVARDMLRTSTALRVGLLVGIGGGIPNLAKGIDIRRGDVVVSKPNGKWGGVVQYDKGKAEKDGKFVLTGQLNKPPTLLLRTLTRVRADHELGSSRVSHYMEDALVRRPQMRTNGFGYPTEPDYLHCSVCNENDEEYCWECGETRRGRLPRNNQSPIIHYGTIVSGNQVIKDAAVRDHLRDAFGALCVEMEAAGLMNDFPCLVIRGVCDYADSHKTDAWHAYAAMCAAAYAKEFLQHISPAQARREQPVGEIADILGKIHDTSKAQLNTTRSENQERKIKYQSIRHTECHCSLKVSPYEIQKNINPERVPGTCQWVLTHRRYSRWISSAGNALLWVSADPGCGKSVLARSLVDNELQDTTNHTICYFFFKDNGEQDELSQALCSLLHQIFSRQPQLIRHALDAWEKNGDKLVKEVYELWRILITCTADDEAHHVTCVLDAVDECRYSDRSRLIKMLTDFYTGRASTSSHKRRSYLKFLVTSRPYEDIESCFRESLEKLPNIRLRGEDENEQIRQEIDIVVKMRVEKLTDDLKLNSQTRDRLTEKLLGMAHRTYLWLYLAIDGIYETHRTSLRPDEAVIETLPSTVEDAYEKILDRVPKAQANNTTQVLRIIVGARRPFTIGEMAIALGVANSELPIELKKAKIKLSWLKKNIRHWCGLFVFINHDRIYLIHQTAKEFLVGHEQMSGNGVGWKHCLEVARNEELLARTCVAFLCSDVVVLAVEKDSLRPRLEKNANSLFKYSAEHWFEHFQHLQILPSDQEFMTEVIKLYDVRLGLFSSWYAESAKGLEWSEHPMETTSRMAMLGHGKVLSWTLQQKTSPRRTKIYLSEALEVAAEYGRNEVVELLLTQDSKKRIRDGSYCNALRSASGAGHEAIIDMLIDHSTDHNFSSCFEDCLQLASCGGHTSVVQTLLRSGTQEDRKSVSLTVSLCKALENHHEELAWVLLRHGGSVSDLVGKRYFPLYAAAASGYELIMQCLVERGARINAIGGQMGTALHAAIRYDHVEAVQMLLDHNASTDIQGTRGTALQMASKLRRTEIVKRLKLHISLDHAISSQTRNGIRTGMRNRRRARQKRALRQMQS